MGLSASWALVPQVPQDFKKVPRDINTPGP